MCVLCFLTACGPHFVGPSASEGISPTLLEHTFTSFDNTILPLRRWLPPQNPEGIIIAVHGFNDYSNFIKDSAPFFNKHNLAVYSYDQRGFGETATRGRWSGGSTLADDLTVFVALVKKEHPCVPVYLLGDSMGGAVTIVTMTRENSPQVEGAILVAPAVWARSAMPFYQRWLLWLAAHTMPWEKVTGKSLEITASDNIAMLKELGKDPLVIKSTRIDVLYGLSDLMDEAYGNAERFSAELLLLYGKRDEIIPEEPVLDFFNRLPMRQQGRQQMILYEDGYHMLLRDLQAVIVMQDIVDWIHASHKPDPNADEEAAIKIKTP